MTIRSDDSAFESLLIYIKQSRGFDLTGYKRTSLSRRFNRRMQVIGVETFADYQDYLEVHPEEFSYLFNTLLINVTSFFRDRAAWDVVRNEVIPRILASKDANAPIRIWSAGCASGEEAYTIAIILAEILDLEQFRRRVKIYATDVDDEALSQARLATYQERHLGGLSPEQVERFFERNNDHYAFLKELRRSVIFGRHDLIQDAPISKIDLLICRNTLMYFNAEAQSQILNRLHFALTKDGFLFLGKAEMLLTYANLFTPFHLKCRIFNKISWVSARARFLGTSPAGPEALSSAQSNQMHLQQLAFSAGSIARVLIDAKGLVNSFNERAKALFKLSLQDIGRPLQDLDLSYRPRELRPSIDKAWSEQRIVFLRDVEMQTYQGERIYLDVQVVPLLRGDGSMLGVSLDFEDVSRYRRLQEELEQSNQELEMAYEELQSANEELETTNEELQSSNEELETTNEELQSTNEELETMNEELQSANEELQAVNDELQHRGQELNQSNLFLESILTSMKGGVVVVNRDLCVQIWNHKAEDLWGVRTEEALDQNFFILDIGLPVEQLRQPIRACLAASETESIEVPLEAVNRRGRKIRCQVTCTPLIDQKTEIRGVILLMEEYPEE